MVLDGGYEARVFVAGAEQSRKRDVGGGVRLKSPGVRLEVETPKIPVGDEVHDAGHRVGPEYRRAAVEQQFRALHGDARHQRVDVHAVPARAVGGRIGHHPPSVQYGQRILVAQAAQVDRGDASRPCPCHAPRIGLGDVVGTEVLGDIVEEIGRQVRGGELHHVLPGMDADRGWGVDSRVQVGTGDYDLFELITLLVLRQNR